MARYIRRLQFTGRSTYIVSLPKKWVTQNNLSPGSQVVIEESNSYLTIKPFGYEESLQRKTAILSVTGGENPEAVARRVIGAYIMGYDEIIVKSETFILPSIRNAIRRTILEKLPGAEIITEDHSQICIQVLLSPKGVPLVDAVKRLARVVESVLEDVCIAVSRGDESLAKEVSKEDDSIDRVFFYAVRIMNQIASGKIEDEKTTVSTVELLMYRSMSKLLERIGDHAVNIANNLSGIIGRWEFLERINDLCLESLNIYRTAVNGFFNANPVVVEEIAKNIISLKNREEELISGVVSSLQPNELVSLRMILESIRRISEYSKDISELALDIGISKLLTDTRTSGQ